MEAHEKKPASGSLIPLRPGAGTGLIFLTILIPVAAFLAGLGWDFGRDVNREYYTTAAQVSATVFVLVVLAAVAFLGRTERQNRKSYADKLAFALTLQTLIVLGASLWVAGNGDSSTFLCLTVAIVLFFQIVAVTFFVFDGGYLT